METRSCVKLLDENGKVLETHFGPTQAELQAAHNQGRCDFLCPICYSEACEYKAKNP